MDVGLICLIYLAGLALLFVEMFVPGSFLGVLGTGVVIASIFLSFWHHPQDPIFGVALVFVSLIVLPAMFIWVMKRITLHDAQNLEEGYSSADETLEDLLGQEGIAVTPLRPSGIAKIGKRRVDVTTENIMLDKDVPVKVVKVEGYRVIVKAIDPPPAQ